MSDDRQSTAYPAGPGADLIPGLAVADGPAGSSGGELPTAEAAAQPYNFDLVLRGYDRHQVHQHLDRVAALVEQLRAELAEATRRERANAAELVSLRGDLERGRPSYDSLGERVGQILGLAESEATQLREDARRDADTWRDAAGREAADIHAGARSEAEQLVAAARSEVEELDRRRTALLGEMGSMRDRLQAVLAGASEPWRPPASEPASLGPTDATSVLQDVNLAETQVIDLDRSAPTTTG
jgi:DivIVA domain-containing protein